MASKSSPLETLRALFKDEKFLTEYNRWRTDPITQRIFEAAALMARPIPLSKPGSKAALYQYGELVGMERILNFVRDPEDMMAAIEQAEADAAYGMDDEQFDATHPHFARARARRTKATPAPAA